MGGELDNFSFWEFSLTGYLFDDEEAETYVS